MSKTKPKKKRRKKSDKGGRFEREMCCLLSEWWSKGRAEDLFWRTSGSGARATRRGRKGKTTTGHCGDVCATDPSGKPLMDVVSIELKRGYSAKSSVLDLFDRPKHLKRQETWENWIEKAVRSQENSDAFAWLLILRRDKRDALVFMPDYLEEHLTRLGTAFPSNPYVRFRVTARFEHGKRTLTVVGMRLDKWMGAVHPDIIKGLAKEI